MLHERRRSILCLMSLIEGRLPAQRCVLVLEHPAPARHTALCRYAARFALFVGSSPASLLACAGKRALHADEQEACNGPYAHKRYIMQLVR